MASDDDPPGNPPNEWGLVLGFLIGIAPVFYFFNVGVDAYMKGARAGASFGPLYVVTIACTAAAGIILAFDSAGKRPRFEVCFRAFVFMVGFIALDVCVGCAGCTCQTLSKLHTI